MSNYYQMSRVEFCNWPEEAYKTATEIVQYLGHCTSLDEDYADIVDGEYYGLNCAGNRWPWLFATLIEIASDFDNSISNNYQESDGDWYYNDGIPDCDILATVLACVAERYGLDIFESQVNIYDIGYDDKRIEGHHTIYTVRTGHYGANHQFGSAERDLIQLQLFSILTQGIESVADALNVTIEQAIRTITDAVSEHLENSMYDLSSCKRTFSLLHQIQNKTRSEQLRIAVARIMNRYNIDTDTL